MKRLLFLLLLSALTLQFGCGGVNKNLKNVTGIKKVAIASFAVNDWGANQTVTAGRGSSASGGFGASKEAQQKALQGATNDLLLYTEKQLGKKYQVKNVAGFVKSKGYKSLTVKKTLDAYVPRIKGQELGLFTGNSRALKSVKLTPDQARQLCATLGVDAVFVVYSEWSALTGRMVPTIKPYTKNLMSLWSKDGQQLFSSRVNQVGSVVMGGMGPQLAISVPKVLEDFKNTYKKSLDRMLK